ncbi:hypothetical protein CaCOL14_012349 [Colletotrichum acutatum]
MWVVCDFHEATYFRTSLSSYLVLSEWWDLSHGHACTANDVHAYCVAIDLYRAITQPCARGLQSVAMTKTIAQILIDSNAKF